MSEMVAALERLVEEIERRREEMLKRISVPDTYLHDALAGVATIVTAAHTTAMIAATHVYERRMFRVVANTIVMTVKHLAEKMEAGIDVSHEIEALNRFLRKIAARGLRKIIEVVKASLPNELFEDLGHVVRIKPPRREEWEEDLFLWCPT